MSEKQRKNVLSKWQIVKARGKAIIISLVSYLKALGIQPVVIHDKDQGVAGAEKFNKPIEEVVGDSSRLHVVENCIEDVLGYSAPSSDKPFKAYEFINANWGKDWGSITSTKLKTLLEDIFKEELAVDEVSEAIEEVATTLE